MQTNLTHILVLKQARDALERCRFELRGLTPFEDVDAALGSIGAILYAPPSSRDLPAVTRERLLWLATSIENARGMPISVAVTLADALRQALDALEAALSIIDSGLPVYQRRARR